MKKSKLYNFKDDIIDLYVNKRLTPTEISKIYNVSYDTVRKALISWNIHIRGLSESHKKYTVNDNYFYVIDNEEKAYWLGFLYADGYLTNKGYIGIALKEDDRYHLQKFTQSLQSDYPIKDYCSNSAFGKCRYSRVVFKSNKMYADLINKGVLQNKSLILKFPTENQLPQELYRHFIRGYFDGDGNLDIQKNCVRVRICGTKEFLTGIIDAFNDISDQRFGYKLYKRYDNDKNNYSTYHGGMKRTYIIMSYLYEDSKIYLDRKMEKYQYLKQLVCSRA